MVLVVVSLATSVLAIAERNWVLLAVSVLVFLPLGIWATVLAERARRDPTWTPPLRRHLMGRPLVTGVCGGIAIALLMTVTMVSENDGPVGLALLISLVVCVPLEVAFAYVGRNDLRRRESNDPPC
jgi:hypothetical protein